MLKGSKIIHHIIKPTMLAAMTFFSHTGGVGKEITRRREKGFDTPLVQKYWDAMNRARIRIRDQIEKENGEVDHHLDSAMLHFTDFSALIFDTEPYWFSKWFNIIHEEFKKEGLLVKQPETTMKNKITRDKYGTPYKREVVK